jgi:hypothetical protein
MYVNGRVDLCALDSSEITIQLSNSLFGLDVGARSFCIKPASGPHFHMQHTNTYLRTHFSLSNFFETETEHAHLRHLGPLIGAEARVRGDLQEGMPFLVIRSPFGTICSTGTLGMLGSDLIAVMADSDVSSTTPTHLSEDMDNPALNPPAAVSGHSTSMPLQHFSTSLPRIKFPLPRELRDQIFGYLLAAEHARMIITSPSIEYRYFFHTSILAVNSTIHKEGKYQKKPCSYLGTC